MFKFSEVIRSDKKLKELEVSLHRTNKLAVIETIKELRNEEPFEGAVSLLASLFNDSDDQAIKRTISDFCNDLKDQGVRTEIIAEIRKPLKQETIGMLVSSCWQSGLDYSEYLSDLASVFLSGNYATAIECMTVIDESAEKCPRENRNKIIRMIEESPLSGLNEKSALTLELISILER